MVGSPNPDRLGPSLGCLSLQKPLHGGRWAWWACDGQGLKPDGQGPKPGGQGPKPITKISNSGPAFQKWSGSNEPMPHIAHRHIVNCHPRGGWLH